jgi:hypothetical protein
MMTNVAQVKKGLKAIAGNRVFTAREVILEGLTTKQVGEAIRAVPYMKNLGNGKYRIKGRRV